MAKSRPKRRKRKPRTGRNSAQGKRKRSTRKRPTRRREARVLDQEARRRADVAQVERAEQRRRAGSLPARVSHVAARWAAWVSAQWHRLPAGVRSPVNLALGAILALVVVVLVVILLVRSTPGYYRDPDTLSDEQLIQWGEGFVGKANDLLTHVVNKERFDVTITEEELNGYLAGFFRPEVRRALSARLSEEFRLELPRGLRGLMVHLAEGEVVLMARYETSRFQPVVSVAGRVQVGSGGRCRFEPLRTRVGRAPVPKDRIPAVAELTARSISLDKHHIRVERVEVHEGTMRVVGRYESSGEEGHRSGPR